ncbi:MAG: TSUP family transporter [Opitutaceae bacterium]|nr:TSUP family transporter [Opitutaceae bacterium]
MSFAEQLPVWAYPLLLAAGFSAGLVDSIAGGGGIISLPVLLNFGLPPQLALGTNKFQSSFGSVSASWQYVRRGLVDLRSCRAGILLTLAGALLGAWAVQRVESHVLERVIPVLLAAIVVYLVFQPQLGLADRPARLGAASFSAIFGLGLGFYDGFFGPGTGSFWAIAFVLLRGHDLPRATAHTKVMNAASNLASLALFAPAGLVHLGAGLVMAAGQVLGARLGAGLVVRRGARFVRPAFLLMAALTIVRLLWINLARPH